MFNFSSEGEEFYEMKKPKW